MRYLLTVLLLLVVNSVLLGQTTNVVSSERADWYKITETTVHFDHKNLNQEMAEILIPGKERFVSIFFRVAESQIDLKSLEVHFENGDKQDIAVNEEIKSNRNSRIMELNGEARAVKKIVFKYKPVPLTDDKMVRLELWGSQHKAIR